MTTVNKDLLAEYERIRQAMETYEKKLPRWLRRLHRKRYPDEAARVMSFCAMTTDDPALCAEARIWLRAYRRDRRDGVAPGPEISTTEPIPEEPSLPTGFYL